MKIDFDTIISRKNTNSLKWDTLGERFGDSDLLPLWVADMDFRAPQPVIEKLAEIARTGIFGYSIEPDSYYLSIINWMHNRHNWNIKKEWITGSPGIVPALNMLIQAFTQPGDNVIIQKPVYYPFMSAISNNNRNILNNNLIISGGKYQIDFDRLRQLASDPKAKLLILCNPHNPVGRVWTKNELEQIALICKKNDLIVIADEIHSDLVYSGHRHVPFASLSHEISNMTVTCTSPSKTFNLAGLQVSNLIIENRDLKNRYTTILRNNGLFGLNIFAIPALETAYNHGEQWLDQLLVYLYRNYLLAKETLENGLPGIKVFQLEGTYLLWADCRSLLSDHIKLERVLKEKGRVALSQGYIFGKDEGKGFIRINIACPRQQLKQAINGVVEALYPYTD